MLLGREGPTALEEDSSGRDLVGYGGCISRVLGFWPGKWMHIGAKTRNIQRRASERGSLGLMIACVFVSFLFLFCIDALMLD